MLTVMRCNERWKNRRAGCLLAMGGIKLIGGAGWPKIRDEDVEGGNSVVTGWSFHRNEHGRWNGAVDVGFATAPPAG